MGVLRRTFLERIGLAGVGAAAGVMALPDRTPSATPTRPADLEGPATDERSHVTGEDETPYALWQYTRLPGRYVPTQPINVVFTLATSDHTFDDLLTVFREATWFRAPTDYVRFAFNPFLARYEPSHAAVAQSYLGGFGRYHVRCWTFDEFVSLQAHRDTVARPGHGVASHESGKHLVEHLFYEAGWRVTPDAVWFDNAAPPDHEGDVTVIDA